MVSEELKKAEKEFAKLMERHDPEVNSRVEDSLYNKIKLLSDGMFEKIFRLPYDKLVVIFANEVSENHSAELTQWLQAKNIYYRNLLNRNRKLLPEINDSINKHESEEKYYHGLDGEFIDAESRYAWELAKYHKYLKQVYQSVRMIVGLKINFIGRLIEDFDILNNTPSPLNITVGDDHSKNLFYFNGSPNELLTILKELENNNALILSKTGMEKLFNLIRFAKVKNSLMDFIHSMEFQSDDEKIIWNMPIRRFGDFLSWLISKNYINLISNRKKFIEEICNLIDFKKCGIPDGENRLESLRKGIFNPLPTAKMNTSISDILDPLLNYSQETS